MPIPLQSEIDELVAVQRRHEYKVQWLFYQLRQMPFTIDDLQYLESIVGYNGGKIGRVLRSQLESDYTVADDDLYQVWNTVMQTADDPDVQGALNAAYLSDVYLKSTSEGATICMVIVIQSSFQIGWIQAEIGDLVASAFRRHYQQKHQSRFYPELCDRMPEIIFINGSPDAISRWHQGLRQAVVYRLPSTPIVIPTAPLPERQLTLFS